MNTLLLRTEFRLYTRDIAAVIFGLIMAPMILVILGSIPSFREPNPDLGGHTVISLYVPIMLMMVLAMVALSAAPLQLAVYRERGILRRLATTPARARDLLLAQAAVQGSVLLTGAAAVVMIGRLAYGVRLPANPAAFVLAFVLTAAALLGIGLMIASLKNSKVVQGVGSATFFPLMFFAGLWVPREAMPESLRNVSDFTPVGAGVQMLQDATAGDWPQFLHLGVLAGWTLVAWVGAVRTFRWS
ncbi:MAG TPA: ABC transporter permease [Candidatus Limnocylindrales bacterium]